MEKIVKKNIGIVGATGYVGQELLSILDSHDKVNICFVSSFNRKNEFLFDVIKPYLNISNLKLEDIKNLDNYDLDIIFFATKHNFSMNYIPNLISKGIKVIDLSADFRFADPKLWKETYESDHKGPELLSSSTYGLPEFNATKIKESNLIAVPGCYPTASLLGLIPIAKYIKPQSKIILDVKSGISGAGRNSVEESLRDEIENNFKAYSPEKHRHQPEIKSFLKDNFGISSEIIFTPHLIPTFRGEYITAYVDLVEFGEDITKLYKNFYKDKSFVRILEKGTIPEIKKVQNTNYCDISIFKNMESTVIHVAIDNLIKGAAGQAIQCLNLMINEKEEYNLEGSI